MIKAFAISNPMSIILINSIMSDKDECILHFQESLNMSWILLSNKGFSCVPILITEIKE